MTGAVQASAAAAGSQTVIVTLGVSGNLVGYIDSGSAGVISFPSFRGIAFKHIFSSAVASHDFLFEIVNPPGVSQNFFHSLTVELSAGGTRTLLSADATFVGGLNNFWFWGDGSNRVWTQADAGNARKVTIS